MCIEFWGAGLSLSGAPTATRIFTGDLPASSPSSQPRGHATAIALAKPMLPSAPLPPLSSPPLAFPLHLFSRRGGAWSGRGERVSRYLDVSSTPDLKPSGDCSSHMPPLCPPHLSRFLSLSFSFFLLSPFYQTQGGININVDGEHRFRNL